MFFLFDRVVLGMAILRFISSSIEFSAAMLMLYFNRVETAFKINSLLALVGPIILFTTTSLGLVGLAGKVSLFSMAIILLGVALIFIGINHM